MEKIKIITLLEHLSEKDKESIHQYFRIKSSAERKEHLLLFELLIKNNENYDKNKIWKSIYPTEKLNNQKFRKLCFETLQEIEHGITVNYIAEHKNSLQEYLIKFYLENNIKDFLETKIEKTRKASLESNKLGSDNFLHQYQIEHLYFLFLQQQENVQNTLNITASSSELDKFYFTQKLKYICNTLNYKAILGKAEYIEFEEEIINLLKSSSLKENILISNYHAIYYLLKFPETEQYFYDAKHLLINHTDKLENSEFLDLVQYLINYCIKKINQSAEQYLNELFEIYQLYLKNMQEKVFSPIRFKNIFLLALKMKKFDWAESFIDTYGIKLPKEQRETTIAYNRARLYYDIKQYDKVLDTILHLHNDEVQFNLISKVLIVKTFYEKKEIQFLENYMLSFKAYILRNKEMNTQNKQIHLNFLKMMKKLIRLEYSSKTIIEKFRLKIESFSNLPDKNWFLEKTDTL